MKIEKKKLKAKYRLHASRVDRIAVVDRPAVPDAQIVAFKSLEGNGDVIDKGVTSDTSLPMADVTTSWNKTEALTRVRNWATKDGCVNMNEYKKAFLLTKNADNADVYELPFADVINGNLKAVPQAIISVLGFLAGARRSVNIPKSDKVKILNQLKKYYAKMELEFPEITIKSVEELEMQGAVTRGFILRGAEAAVDALESAVWDAIYYQDIDETKAINEIFNEFSDIIVNFIAKLGKKLKAIDTGDKFTKEDVVNAFVRSMNIVAMSEIFKYFKQNISYILMSYKYLADPKETIEEIIVSFKEQIVKYVPKIVQNKKDERAEIEQSDIEEVEKAGRILSKARLSKIKEAVGVLSLIITEAEERYQNKKIQEADNMELKEIIKNLEELTASVKSIKDEIPNIVNGILGEKGLILTEEKQKEIEKQETEAKEKAEAEAKAEVEAKEKAEVEAQKALKQKEDAVNARFDKIEEALKSQSEATKSMGETLDAIANRFSVKKKSVDPDEGQTGEITAEKSDPFGEAVIHGNYGKK